MSLATVGEISMLPLYMYPIMAFASDDTQPARGLCRIDLRSTTINISVPSWVSSIEALCASSPTTNPPQALL